MTKTVQDMLVEAHRHNARLPIEGPDEQGAFPAPGLRAWGLLGAGIPPVALDANPLRNDILRACRSGRTVLITAANVGALRLYAASHVTREVHRHGDRWAKESGVSAAEFWTRWEEEYLPLLRVIDDRHLSVELLGDEERARAARLATIDPDDIPSVILSLVLGAFFLSEDRPALRAVYGKDVDLEAHRGWLALLRCSGDAGELGKMVFAASMLPTIAGGGAVEVGRWVSRKLSPWALVPIGLSLLLLARRHLDAERLAGLRDGAGKLAWGFVHIYLRYQREYERFAAAAAPAPTWSRLAAETDGRAALARACMHRLARTPGGHRSVSELAGELPALGVGQGEALVREVLRGGRFQEVYAGRWQLGTAASTGSRSRLEASGDPTLPAAGGALNRERGARRAARSASVARAPRARP